MGAALLTARSHRRLASGLLAVIVTADLGLGSSHLLNFGDPGMLTGMPPAARAIRADHGRAGRPAPRLFRAAEVQESAARAGGGTRELRSIETLRDNVSVPFGIAILPGYEAALPPAIAALLGRRQTNVLRLFAVDYALLPAGPDPAAAPAGLLPLADPLAGVRLYRIARTLPRVFLGFRAETLPAAEARNHLLDDAVADGRRVLLAGGTPLDGPESDPVPCAIERILDNARGRPLRRSPQRARGVRRAIRARLDRHGGRRAGPAPRRRHAAARRAGPRGESPGFALLLAARPDRRRGRVPARPVRLDRPCGSPAAARPVSAAPSGPQSDENCRIK